MKKNSYFYIKKALKIWQNVAGSESLEDTRKALNQIATVYGETKKLITQLENEKNWHLLQNVGYENLPDAIEKIWLRCSDQWHRLNWEKFGFNAYDV